MPINYNYYNEFRILYSDSQHASSELSPMHFLILYFLVSKLTFYSTDSHIHLLEYKFCRNWSIASNGFSINHWETILISSLYCLHDLCTCIVPTTSCNTSLLGFDFPDPPSNIFQLKESMSQEGDICNYLWRNQSKIKGVPNRNSKVQETLLQCRGQHHAIPPLQ